MSEGFSLSSWIEEQTAAVSRAIRELAARAEGILDNALQGLREFTGDLRERLADMARRAIETINVTEAEIEQQKRVLESAKAAVRALMSSEERGIEAEGRRLREQRSSARATTDLLLELSTRLPDGHLQEVLERQARVSDGKAGAGSERWRWAADQLREATRRHIAHGEIAARARDAARFADIDAEDADEILLQVSDSAAMGAGAGAGAKSSACDCLRGDIPKIGAYDPDAWGSQCRDWDGSNYDWCIVANGAACRDYPMHRSSANRNRYWRRCGLGVWASRQAVEATRTVQAVRTTVNREVDRRVTQASAAIDRGMERGREIVDDVAETVVETHAAVVEEVTERIDDAREALTRGLEALDRRIDAAFQDFVNNIEKKRALDRLAGAAVKLEAMKFAFNAKKMIEAAISFITNEGAQAVRDAVPDLLVVGVHGSLNQGVGGAEIVYDMATLQRMSFTYVGLEVGTKAWEVAGVSGSIGVGWKGNTEDSALSAAYSGGFVSVSAGAGLTVGIASLSLGGLFAVSSTDNFRPIPGAVKTLAITGGASVGLELPFSAGVGFTTYTANKPGDCYDDVNAFVRALVFDLRIPDVTSRVMGALGAYARSQHHTAAARAAQGECRRR
jgi:hypothetical protein